MKINVPKSFLGICAAAMVMAVTSAAFAADAFPSKPISWVVPYPTGGFGDSLSRSIAQKMAKTLGVPVIVENRPGAGAQIGVNYVKRQPADGYTILYGDLGPFSMNPGLYPKLDYNMQTDFVPLTRLLATPTLLVVRADSPLNSVDELIKASKDGGRVTYGSYGVGSAPHVWGEMLRLETGGNFEHVAYKGASPALQDLVGGHIDVINDVVASSAPFVRDGRIKALAVVGVDERLPEFSNIPTLTELGYGSLNMLGWTGVAVKAGTPQPIVDKLYAAVVDAINTPEVVRPFTELGMFVAPQEPDEFRQYISSETARWGEVIRKAGISLD